MPEGPEIRRAADAIADADPTWRVGLALSPVDEPSLYTTEPGTLSRPAGLGWRTGTGAGNFWPSFVLNTEDGPSNMGITVLPNIAPATFYVHPGPIRPAEVTSTPPESFESRIIVESGTLL